jgi:plastocyanin
MSATQWRRTIAKTSDAALVAAFVCGGMIGAFAAEQTIGQKGRNFSAPEITLSVNDTLIFKNDDDVTHNIYSKSPGNEFNLGAQRPGVSTPISFSTPGEITVLCVIHPRMQMTVKVVK